MMEQLASNLPDTLKSSKTAISSLNPIAGQSQATLAQMQNEIQLQQQAMQQFLNTNGASAEKQYQLLQQNHLLLQHQYLMMQKQIQLSMPSQQQTQLAHQNTQEAVLQQSLINQKHDMHLDELQTAQTTTYQGYPQKSVVNQDGSIRNTVVSVGEELYPAIIDSNQSPQQDLPRISQEAAHASQQSKQASLSGNIGLYPLNHGPQLQPPSKLHKGHASKTHSSARAREEAKSNYSQTGNSKRAVASKTRNNSQTLQVATPMTPFEAHLARQILRFPLEPPRKILYRDLRTSMLREECWKLANFSHRQATLILTDRIQARAESYTEVEKMNFQMHGSVLGRPALPHQRFLSKTYQVEDVPHNFLLSKLQDMFILVPQHKAHLGRGYYFKDYDFTSALHYQVSTLPEELVPIRVDIESMLPENTRYRDYFSININDPTFSAEAIAEATILDLGLPANAEFKAAFASSISTQLADYKNFRISHTCMKEQDLRIIISLDIVIGDTALVDHFEWDVACEENIPEQFAQSYCRELCLSGEFEVAIAHSIREQIHTHLKSLLMVGYPFDGSPIAHISSDLADSFLIPVAKGHAVRSSELSEFFAPYLSEATIDDWEKGDKELDKDGKRKRRPARKSRSSVTLPVDTDPQRTRPSHYPHQLIKRMRYKQTINIAQNMLFLAQNAYFSDFKPALSMLEVAKQLKLDVIPVKTAKLERSGNHSSLLYSKWTCFHCGAYVISTPVARAGPEGERTLCNLCGLRYSELGYLPSARPRGVELRKLRRANEKGQASFFRASPDSNAQLGTNGQDESVCTPTGNLDSLVASDTLIPSWALERRADLWNTFGKGCITFVKASGAIKMICEQCGPQKFYSVGPGLSLARMERHLRRNIHLAPFAAPSFEKGSKQELEKSDMASNLDDAELNSAHATCDEDNRGSSLTRDSVGPSRAGTGAVKSVSFYFGDLPPNDVHGEDEAGNQQNSDDLVPFEQVSGGGEWTPSSPHPSATSQSPIPEALCPSPVESQDYSVGALYNGSEEDARALKHPCRRRTQSGRVVGDESDDESGPDPMRLRVQA